MNQIRTITTVNCNEQNHAEFRVDIEFNVPQVDVDIFVSFLEQSVNLGERFIDGQTIEYGSMIIQIVHTNGFLTLNEPDLSTFPISWKSGITESVKLLRLQKDIAESVGLENEMDFSSIRHSLLVGVDLTDEYSVLILDRTRPSGLDSGWFLGKANSKLDYNDSKNLRPLSVYEAILRWPQIAGFLALPSGSRVETSKPLNISQNNQTLQIRIGSFLDVASI